MKIVKITMVVLLVSAFLLTGCGSKPQAVSKDQFDQARVDAETEEARVAELQEVRNNLAEEVTSKEAKIEALLEIEKGWRQ